MKKYLYSALPFAFVLGVEASDVSNVSYVEHMEIHAGENELVAIGPGCTIVTVPDTQEFDQNGNPQEIRLSSIYEALDDLREGKKEKLMQLMMHPKYGDDIIAIVNAASNQKFEEMERLMVAVKQKLDEDQAQRQHLSSIDEALCAADNIEKQTQKNEINERRRTTLEKLNLVFKEETGHWMDEFMIQILPNKSDSTIFCLIDDPQRLTTIDLMLLNAHNGTFSIPRRAYSLFPALFDDQENFTFRLALAFAQYDNLDAIKEVTENEAQWIKLGPLESMKNDMRNWSNLTEEISDSLAFTMYLLIRSLQTNDSGTKVLDYLLNHRPELMYFTVKNSPLLSLAFSYGNTESINYLTEKGFDPNTGFPKGFQPSLHDYIFPLMAASLCESMSSNHIDFLTAHHVDLFQYLSLTDPMTLAVIKSALNGSESCNEIAKINALAVLSIKGMGYMFLEKLMKQNEFTAANSLHILAGVELKNQKRFPVWLSWWEKGTQILKLNLSFTEEHLEWWEKRNAGIPIKLVEMGILKLDDYRDDIDRFFADNSSIWDLIGEAAGRNITSQISQQNTLSNSQNSQQESQQSNNTMDITTEVMGRNTPKKSMGKAKKREKKEEKSAIETEKEIRQQSKQKVAGWLIDHGFQLSQKNVPGFLADDLLRKLHAAVNSFDLLGVQKLIKQGGKAIGNILKLQLEGGITVLDVVNFQLDDTSQEESSTKKGRNQKKAKRGKQLTNTKDPQLIEIKKALEAVMPQGNSNSQETNISENSGNSENEQKEDTKNEDLEQNKENNEQSVIESNEKTETGKETLKSKAEKKGQTSKVETKTSKKTDSLSPQAAPEETTQTESKTSEKKTLQVVLPDKQRRRQERQKLKQQAKLVKERQEQQKALEKQNKSNKVEKPETMENVKQTETGEAEKTEIIEKMQKPAEQEQTSQKIEISSKNFQRNVPQKQEFPRSPSWDFENVNKGKGKSIKIKAIPLPEDIMGTKFDKETQTPRLRQRQIIRANLPRLQFFHDDTFNVSVGPTPPIPPKNKTLQSAPVVSISPDLWDSRKFLDQETYRIFEEELKKPNPDFTLIAPNEQNILHYYARFGKIGEIENLYATHPDTFKQLLNSSDIGGWTALHLAVKYGHGEIIQFLVQHGANDLIVQSARDFAYNCYRKMFYYFDE